MSREVEGRITATASRQHGVITRVQLMEAGLSSAAVGSRRRAGRLRVVHRGVYLLGPLSPPHAREMAAVLAGGPNAFLSHLSAASLWGMTATPGRSRSGDGEEMWDASWRSGDPEADPVDITVEGGSRGHRPGIRVHRTTGLERDERTSRYGIPITAPERTVVDVAGMLGSRDLEVVVARAERKGLLNLKDTSALLHRYRGRRGIAMLRAVLELRGGPGLTRSEAESRFLQLVRQAGLPPPEANVAMGPYEIDFLWRAEGIAVEVDGFKYHSSRPRFEGDRRKDAWLLGRGITVIRLSWHQIVREALATAVRVGQALARAGKCP